MRSLMLKSLRRGLKWISEAPNEIAASNALETSRAPALEAELSAT